MILRWLVLWFWALPVMAEPCYNDTYKAHRFSVCIAQKNDDLRLFHSDNTGAPFGQFFTLSNHLKAQRKSLTFAMNGGMYHPDLSPVGHYIENGIQKQRVIASAGPGNFGMLPNGIFCIDQKSYAVYETTAYLENKPTCEFATQSGPMLLINGEYHPRFAQGSQSVNIRNGVAVVGSSAYFVISNDRVNLFDFAQFFKERLGATDALYLDGKVSRLYAPDLGRSDFGWPIGPMIGVVADQ
jgi:uncharacterized protein YigE (DUF2233 family)